jgi:heat shock protein HslJ
VACGSSKSAASSEEPLSLQKEQVWQLTAMRGRHVKALITLSFNTEAATLNGTATCNRYGADCRLAYSANLPEGYRYTVAVDNLTAGTTLCPEADMNAEARYLALLPKADALLLTAYNLTLFQRDKEILRFELQ